ncbi:MAG: c-type cytochrome [Phenylobacterium sp.]
MTVRLLAAATAAALALGAAPCALAQDPNDALPEGPGKSVVVRACTGCHDASSITGKPRAPKDWEFLIGKMIDNGAQLTPEDQDAVYAYVVKNFGVKPETPAQPAQVPPASASNSRDIANR